MAGMPHCAARRHRAWLRFNRANPAFVCLKHEDESNPGLYIKTIKGQTGSLMCSANDGCHQHVRAGLL
jgi:hypothetical protein